MKLINTRNKLVGLLTAGGIFFLLLLSAGCRKKKKSELPPPPPPKSSAKAITSFLFTAADNSTVLIQDVAGVIGTDTITATLDESISISNLVPTIVITGTGISPLSRVAQNFNTLVAYTVTAEDGTTKRYIVKIVQVRSNATVYIGSDDRNLYALHAGTGLLKWKYTTGGSIQSSPTVVGNTVYFGSFDTYLYAVNATTGELKWRYQTLWPITGQGPVAGDGNIYITSTPGYPTGGIFAVDTATGLLKWSKTNLVLPAGPTYAEGKVFVNDFGGSVKAFDAVTGNLVWSYFSVGISKSNPAYANGKLYLAGEGQFYCFNATTGTILWNYPFLPMPCGPTIDNGTMYAGSGSDLVALDANTGAFKWQRQSYGGANGTGGAFSSPVVNGSVIYA
ncbi:MAG: PQQ-binding-like beta-propeller repeat protein, partial [Chitinophagaceae bacterium]